jgi:hypothetical protein
MEESVILEAACVNPEEAAAGTGRQPIFREFTGPRGDSNAAL